MTAAIVLAAGSSSRMGRSKQLLNVHGQPLLLRTIQAVQDASIYPVIVVLGAREAEHKVLLDGLDVDIMINPNWESGIGSSIKSGLKRLMLKYPDASAVLILVCDQPLLTAEIIAEITDTFDKSNKGIIASTYTDVPGVPVLFARSYFDKLKSLGDNEGAKKLILKNPGDVELVPFPGGEIDLDTIDDYDTFMRDHHK